MFISEGVAVTEMDMMSVDKRQKIAAIRERDLEAYQTWLATNGDHRTLNIPDAALRYLAIPERLYELVEDPEKLGVITTVKNDTQLVVYVVEHRDEELCSEAEFLDYQERYQTYLSTISRLSLRDRKNWPPPPEKPAGLSKIDKSDVAHLIKNGTMKLSDFVCLYESFDIFNDDVLKVANFQDRDETIEGVKLRGNKVAKSFYTGLRERAVEMGFKFLLGDNASGNIWFFRDVLRRYTLDQIKKEKWTELTGLYEDEIDAVPDEKAQLVTIDILDPNLIKDYVL